jgi:hypothetical protein
VNELLLLSVGIIIGLGTALVCCIGLSEETEAEPEPMSRIDPEILARIRLDPASVRLGLEDILAESNEPIVRDNALTLIQRILDAPDGVRRVCEMFPAEPKDPA